MNKAYTYHAFISYKREDERWAKWLQEKLEYFKLPVVIADSSEEYLRPVFRDVLISVHKSKADRYNKVQFLDLRENRNKASVQLVGNQWSINTLEYDSAADYLFIEDTSGVFVYDKKSGIQVFSLHDCRHSKLDNQYRMITVVRNGNCIETYEFPSRQDLVNSCDGLLRSELCEEDKYAFFLK